MVDRTQSEPKDQIRSQKSQYRRLNWRNFPGHEKFPNGANVADQAKLSDAAKVPDKRPPPRLDTLGLDSELAVRNRQICTATDKPLIETSVLDGFRRLQVR